MDIPKWIIEASFLIDAANSIKMVGTPWINEDMTELFYKIVTSLNDDFSKINDGHL